MCQYAALFLSLLLLSWFYVAKISKDVPSSNAAIQLNIIQGGSVISKINLSEIEEKNTENGGGKKRFKHHVPKFMLELYENGRNNGKNYTKPDIVRSLIPKTADTFFHNTVSNRFEDNHLLTFELPTSKEDEIFLNAELKVLTIVDIKEHVFPGLERIVQLSVYDDRSENLIHLQKYEMFYSNNTWLTFNLTIPVANLVTKDPRVHRTLKIVISIASFTSMYKYESKQFKLSLLPIRDDIEHDYPVLLLSYSLNNAENKNKSETIFEKRRKRNVEDDYEEETNNVWDDENVKKSHLKKMKRIKNTCRRKPMYVDFEEIKYDEWIVQPKGYEAYQCQGKCFYPVADHLNPTKHAIVQTLLHSVAPSKVSRSCCVPTKLESISVLYVDDNGVLTYRYAYKDMVVTECGCR